MRRAGLAVCLAATLLAAPACAGDDGGGGEGGGDERVVRLVIPDNNIRVEGAECAGARPFEYLHANAPYTLESADGEVLVEGELPAGHAENAEPGTDWGVEEIPTVCVMRLAFERRPRGRDLPAAPPRGRADRVRVALPHRGRAAAADRRVAPASHGWNFFRRLAYSAAVGTAGPGDEDFGRGTGRGDPSYASHAVRPVRDQAEPCGLEQAACSCDDAGARALPRSRSATPGRGARVERRDLFMSHVPRRGRAIIGVLLAFGVFLAMAAAATAAPPGFRPIDQQEAEYQDDMTWEDYKTVPGTDWANPALQPTIEKWKVAIILTEFADQPLNITHAGRRNGLRQPADHGEQHPARAGGAVLRGLPQHAEPAEPLHDDEQLLDGDVARPVRRRAGGLRPVHADGQPVGVLAP